MGGGTRAGRMSLGRGLGLNLLVSIMEKTDKENSHQGIWWSECPGRVQGIIRDVPGTTGTFGPVYLEIQIQGAECPRDRRAI